jgi:hypothetical protein
MTPRGWRSLRPQWRKIRDALAIDPIATISPCDAAKLAGFLQDEIRLSAMVTITTTRMESRGIAADSYDRADGSGSAGWLVPAFRCTNLTASRMT